VVALTMELEICVSFCSSRVGLGMGSKLFLKNQEEIKVSSFSSFLPVDSNVDLSSKYHY
jgi:hypothetical protein